MLDDDYPVGTGADLEEGAQDGTEGHDEDLLASDLIESDLPGDAVVDPMVARPVDPIWRGRRGTGPDRDPEG